MNDDAPTEDEPRDRSPMDDGNLPFGLRLHSLPAGTIKTKHVPRFTEPPEGDDA